MNRIALFFVLMVLLGTARAAAEEFVCTEPIGVFDPTAPDKQIGQFNAGTKLQIGKQAETPGMFHISFLGKDGKFVFGLCRAEDLGKAPKSSSGPKPVIRTNSGRARGFEWLEDYPQASQYAKDENKLLLMDFTGSDWCGWCKKLDREVFSTPEFKAYAEQNLVLLKVDFPHSTPQSASVKAQNEGLASQFRIDGYPTVIILNSQGSKVGTLGYMEGGPAAFIAELKKLKP